MPATGSAKAKGTFSLSFLGGEPPFMGELIIGLGDAFCLLRTTIVRRKRNGKARI